MLKIYIFYYYLVMKNIILIFFFIFFTNTSFSEIENNCKGLNHKKYDKCFGTKIFLLGDKYQGYWKKGKRHGKGRHNWPNGDVYLGQFKNDKQHGIGNYTWSNGEKYSGNFLKGIRIGKGVYTWPSGEKYFGEFDNNKRHGQGTHIWPNGEKYVGQFVEGSKSGSGTYTWPNGEKYIGEFKNNLMHGIGKKILISNKVVYGIWENDKFNNEKTNLWLGQRYRDGKELPQDYKLALKHFLLSAEYGNKIAMKEISLLYISKKIDVKLSAIEETINFFNYKNYKHKKSIITSYMWASLSGEKKLINSFKLENDDLSKANDMIKKCINNKYKNC